MRVLILAIFMTLGCVNQGYHSLPEHLQYHGVNYLCPEGLVQYGDPRFPNYYTCALPTPQNLVIKEFLHK